MSDTNPQPIATYRENSPFAKREFELFANKITIRGKSRQSDYVHHIPLDQVSPDIGTQTLNRNNPIFGVGICLLGVGLLVVLVTERISPMPAFVEMLAFIFGLFLLCLIGHTFTRGKYPSYHFFNTQGVKVLDMISAGPDRMHCREFAEHVSQTIKNLRGL